MALGEWPEEVIDIFAFDVAVDVGDIDAGLVVARGRSAGAVTFGSF